MILWYLMIFDYFRSRDPRTRINMAMTHPKVEDLELQGCSVDVAAVGHPGAWSLYPQWLELCHTAGGVSWVEGSVGPCHSRGDFGSGQLLAGEDLPCHASDSQFLERIALGRWDQLHGSEAAVAPRQWPFPQDVSDLRALLCGAGFTDRGSGPFCPLWSTARRGWWGLVWAGVGSELIIGWLLHMIASVSLVNGVGPRYTWCECSGWCCLAHLCTLNLTLLTCLILYFFCRLNELDWKMGPDPWPRARIGNCLRVCRHSFHPSWSTMDTCVDHNSLQSPTVISHALRSGGRRRRCRVASFCLGIGFRKLCKHEVSDRTFPNSDTPPWRFMPYQCAHHFLLSDTAIPRNLPHTVLDHFCTNVWQAIGPSQIRWCLFREPWVSEMFRYWRYVCSLGLHLICWVFLETCIAEVHGLGDVPVAEPLRSWYCFIALVNPFFSSVSWFLNTIGIHRHIHTPRPFSPQYVVMVASMVPQPGECGFFVWDTCVTVAFVQKFLYFASALAGTIGFQTGALKLS